MFGIFKSASSVKQVVQKRGLQKASEHYAGMILEKIPNQRIYRQFILEELDGARQGNDAAKAFVNEVPIARHEYVGSIRRSFPEVDGPNGPQQTLLCICLELRSDVDQMAALRIGIVREILRRSPYPLSA